MFTLIDDLQLSWIQSWGKFGEVEAPAREFVVVVKLGKVRKRKRQDQAQRARLKRNVLKTCSLRPH